MFHFHPNFAKTNTMDPPPTIAPPYDQNSRLMVTAVVSLCFVVFLVVILHIYARCVLRQRAHHRSSSVRLQQLGLAISQLQTTIEPPPKTGLDPSVIASLPVFVFKQADTTKDETRTIECAVCLSILEEDEMARLLPNCNHTFHAECIDRWLGSHSTCPICRTDAQPCEAVAGGAPPLSPPSPPPLERVNSVLVTRVEGTSADGGVQSSAKVGGSSSSRLSSFRRMLSRERSSRRIQSRGHGDDGQQDIERQ
ncbi:unnamed protein product [Camellia sinensis]